MRTQLGLPFINDQMADLVLYSFIRDDLLDVLGAV